MCRSYVKRARSTGRPWKGATHISVEKHIAFRLEEERDKPTTLHLLHRLH